ncbi:hypothetical protein AAE478_010444 [Parahypoxylon ruwenzoriense]
MSFSPGRLVRLLATCSLACLGQAVGTDGDSSSLLEAGSGIGDEAPTDGVMAMPLRRVVEHQGVVTPSLARRLLGADLREAYGTAYYVDLTIGTGGKTKQTVQVVVDTGSYELWVNPDCSEATAKWRDFCDELGHYDPALSPTARRVKDPESFFIDYALGNVSAVYYTDDVYISGVKIANHRFGVASESAYVWNGFMGLGYGQDHGTVSYPIVVDSLAAQGHINSKLFSMDLGAQSGSDLAVTGEIVFGGVDTNKYSGYLAKIPIVPPNKEYGIKLNSISVRAPESNGGTSSHQRRQEAQPIKDANLPLTAVVDSGTTFSIFPESVVNALARGFPGAKSDGNGGYTVPCSLRDADGSVEFEFLTDGSSGSNGGKLTIAVSYRDFIWDRGDYCFMGAQHDANFQSWILGDTFMRAAYATFDQSNNALFMAQYQRCGDKPNRVAVPAGRDAAAKVRGACKKGRTRSSGDMLLSSDALATAVCAGEQTTARRAAAAPTLETIYVKNAAPPPQSSPSSQQ